MLYWFGFIDELNEADNKRFLIRDEFPADVETYDPLAIPFETADKLNLTAWSGISHYQLGLLYESADRFNLIFEVGKNNLLDIPFQMGNILNLTAWNGIS